MKKVLLIGPNSIHLQNYYDLMKGSVAEFRVIIPISKDPIACADQQLSFSFKKGDTIRGITEAISILNADVVHVHQANSPVVFAALACRRVKVPLVITCWGSDILRFSDRNFILRKAIQFALNKASMLTADSKNLAQASRKLLKEPTRMIVSNFGVEIIKEGLKENVIYSNRLHNPLYRIDKIIEAFAAFKQSDKNDWRLVVGAEGSLTNKLQKLAIDLGVSKHIEFVGWLDKRKNDMLYAKSKVYVSIPETDGTSVSLLESMSAGCVPLVSDIAANHEWVKDGVNGFIVKNVRSNFFREIANAEFESMKEKNKEIIVQKASKKKAIENFQLVYQKAADDSA